MTNGLHGVGMKIRFVMFTQLAYSGQYPARFQFHCWRASMKPTRFHFALGVYRDGLNQYGPSYPSQPLTRLISPRLARLLKVCSTA